jgi:hypothetical protein
LGDVTVEDSGTSQDFALFSEAYNREEGWEKREGQRKEKVGKIGREGKGGEAGG